MELVKLPYTFIASILTKVANDLTQIKMKNNHKLITLDIKDLYINIPIKDIQRIDLVSVTLKLTLRNNPSYYSEKY